MEKSEKINKKEIREQVQILVNYLLNDYSKDIWETYFKEIEKGGNLAK